VSPGTAVAYAIVALSAGIAGICALGLVRSPSALDRLHFASAISTVCPFLLAVAVLVHDSLHQTALKAFCAAVIMLVTGPILVHATAQAVSTLEDEGPG
jgi:monovalent cation/proton antiporter MnhG/PhaG subunit